MIPIHALVARSREIVEILSEVFQNQKGNIKYDINMTLKV